METSRTKNSFLNMSSNFIILIIQTILSFAARTYFIRILGESNLGLDGLFTNILSMLSITELGISTAISFILYKPLNNHDRKKISIIMSFYKKMYFGVGTIILFLGIALLPFLPLIVKDYSITNMYGLYFIYLISTASMYFISYKEILIIADQKNYKLSIFNFLFMVIMFLMQIVVLIVYKSFVLYLLVMLVVKTLQRLCINAYISKRYADIDFGSKEKLSDDEIGNLKRNVKSLLYSKVGDYCIFSTDNIFISSIINLATVGVYANYASIVTMSRSLINSIFSGIVASFGNLAENENEKMQENVFEIIDFMSFILYGFCTIAFLLIINSFIKIWLGDSYVLDSSIVLIISINFYLMGTQVPLDTIKQACGFYYRDRFVPLIQTCVNIFLSFVLGKIFGLWGILLATGISYLILPLWIKPYLVYKYIFKDSSLKYFLKQLKNVLVLFAIYIVAKGIISNIVMNNFISLIISFLVLLIIFTIFICLLYSKSKEYQYVCSVLKDIICKMKGYVIKNDRK